MEEEIERTLEVLKKGGIILYPTDTVWGIGCDATNPQAVERIYKLKKRDDNKAMICLVNSVKMLEQFVDEVPDPAYDVIEYSNKPTTIIYDNPVRVANNLVGPDETLGIRVVKEPFCEKLIYSYVRIISILNKTFTHLHNLIEQLIALDADDLRLSLEEES